MLCKRQMSWLRPLTVECCCEVPVNRLLIMLLEQMMDRQDRCSAGRRIPIYNTDARMSDRLDCCCWGDGQNVFSYLICFLSSRNGLIFIHLFTHAIIESIGVTSTCITCPAIVRPPAFAYSTSRNYFFELQKQELMRGLHNPPFPCELCCSNPEYFRTITVHFGTWIVQFDFKKLNSAQYGLTFVRVR